MDIGTGVIIAVVLVLPIVWSSKSFTPCAKVGTTYLAIIITGGILLW